MDTPQRVMNKRFSDWLDARGMRKNFAARKIGMGEATISLICNNKMAIPKKYWRAIAKFTNNDITVMNLLDEALEEKEKTLHKACEEENSVAV